MDAVEFLKEGFRMCDAFGDCKGCPGEAGACFINDTDKRENPEGVVAAVEKFVAENPKTTRQAELLMIYPEAPLATNGALCILPCQIDKLAHDARENGHCNTCCDDCRRKYWFADCKTKNKFSL